MTGRAKSARTLRICAERRADSGGIGLRAEMMAVHHSTANNCAGRKGRGSFRSSSAVVEIVFKLYCGGQVMDLIVEMRFGSHLYGTATEQSDLDYKAVYLPDARAILLQRVPGTIAEIREKPAGEKNAPGDVDREAYGLQRYLELLAEGQTLALDMLFAPDLAMQREPAPLWREIQTNADRLVTRRASAFVRYCRQQANKYGIKGSRIATAR